MSIGERYCSPGVVEERIGLHAAVEVHVEGSNRGNTFETAGQQLGLGEHVGV